MKISTKGDYGLRAMLELARRYGEGLVPSQEIATGQGIPESYLDQLLTTLGKARLVRSARGPQGGHSLAKPPAQITLSEIVTALEGSTAPVSCVTDQGYCHLTSACVLREVWQKIEEATHEVLTSTTLEDLVQRQRAREARAMYYI
ncbi:MAG: Rrf2 family transcriptional regulator [Chloroflexi bacterium]|nr:Rrf2 family transcriptional regulator [Chloroflexota bacterium]